MSRPFWRCARARPCFIGGSGHERIQIQSVRGEPNWPEPGRYRIIKGRIMKFWDASGHSETRRFWVILTAFTEVPPGSGQGKMGWGHGDDTEAGCSVQVESTSNKPWKIQAD